MILCWSDTLEELNMMSAGAKMVSPSEGLGASAFYVSFIERAGLLPFSTYDNHFLA